MSNSRPIKDILRPIARGLIAVFCERVTQAADSQRSVMWTLDHWQDNNVPIGFVAELKMTLRWTGNGVEPPKRRASDKNVIEELTSDRSTDA